jgi:hypothetical protein
MGWFGITADERQQCLTYYEAGLTVIAFLAREERVYNSTLDKYRNMATENPSPQAWWCIAASFKVQAVREAIRRYDQIRPIPDAASTLHLAWRAFLVSYLSFSEALTKRPMSYFAHARSLAERQLAQSGTEALDHAHEADKAFLQGLLAKATETEPIHHRIRSTTAADPWRPKPTVHDEVATSCSHGKIVP